MGCGDACYSPNRLKTNLLIRLIVKRRILESGACNLTGYGFDFTIHYGLFFYAEKPLSFGFD